jgi:hypothetical protein
MNLFKELVLSAPVSSRLQFGFNENIIISAVDTAVRKHKGLPIKANTFITISQVDPVTRKTIAQNEFNFFNLDSTSDFVASNFIEQMTTLASIIVAMDGDIEKFDNALTVAVAGAEVDELVKTKDGAKTMQEALQTGFYDSVVDKLGPACPLMKCKLVVNKKGFLEMCKVAGWILPMTSTDELPEINAHDLKVRQEALSAPSTPTQAKPDELGASKSTVPSAEKSVASAIGFSGL